MQTKQCQIVSMELNYNNYVLWMSYGIYIYIYIYCRISGVEQMLLCMTVLVCLLWLCNQYWAGSMLYYIVRDATKNKLGQRSKTTRPWES
jgi:hypothetical protein